MQNNEPKKKTNVPTVISDDGGFTKDNRLIRGNILRYVDKVWSDSDGTPSPEGARYVVAGTNECAQRWLNKKPVETITEKPLPDVNELNAQIPQEEWEPGLDGRPRPPWGRQVIVYLLDPKTASELSFVSSTVGGRIAYEQLVNRIGNMKMLRGRNVAPVVTLASKQMKTQFGTRMRPEFQIEQWVEFGPSAPALTHDCTTPELKKIEAPSLKEEMNDEIPFSDSIDNI